MSSVLKKADKLNLSLSLSPSDFISCHGAGSVLVEVMDCFLMAP